MTLKFDITKYKYDPNGNPDQWLLFLRRFEIDNVLNGAKENVFNSALELGCGDGKSSPYLARFCKHLIALEYNKKRIQARDTEKVQYVVGDAQDLSQFEDGQFDLILSSNVLEHLPELDKCLCECARVAAQDALIIHSVPNRTWKAFNMLLYHPALLRRALCRATTRSGPNDKVGSDGVGAQMNSNLETRKKRPLRLKVLAPSPHGISASHWREFLLWGQKRWLAVFERNGFELVRIVRQPFYFGYGYSFPLLLRMGNRLGLSSCTSYVLRKAR